MSIAMIPGMGDHDPPDRAITMAGIRAVHKNGAGVNLQRRQFLDMRYRLEQAKAEMGA